MINISLFTCSVATRLILIPLALLAMMVAPAAAATSTWTAAGTTSNWSDAGNWDAPPTPNCIMVFPAGAAFASKGSPVNDLIGQTIDQLNISETYSITGNAISCKNINDNSAGIVNISLPISTAGSAVLTVSVLSATGTLNLAGRLTGAGPVTYAGAGTKRLVGTVNNTLSGTSSVALGNLVLASSASGSIAGPLHVLSGATVTLSAAPEIKNNVVVTVDGTFDMSAATGTDGLDTEIIGGLAGTDTSAVVSLGAKTLGCTAQLAPSNYIGSFQGTGGFRQSTSGVQVLSGTSFPYTGTTTLAGGSIHIWGQLLNSPVVVTGGTLVMAAGASVGDVTLSGASSVLAFDETISAMTMRGTTPTLTVGSGSTFQVVSKSPTDYAQVTTTVGASINGAILSVDTSTYTPTVASVMVIIQNNGSGPISGTFAGLAQGATVVSASNTGTTFTISYTGGSGNDVTLTGVTVATDTTAPALSAITAGTLTGNSATITWTTNEASTSQVEYGLTNTYGSLSTLDTSPVTAHSVVLSNLLGSTTYNYRVFSRDAAGNRAISANATFTTAADTTAPVVTATTPSGATPTTVTVGWTTDEVSDSQVEYGLTSAYGSTTMLDTSMVTAHSVLVSGLTVSTTYHYRVLSRDSAGNLTTGSDGTFATSDAAGVGGSGGLVVSVSGDDDKKRCGAGSGTAITLLGMALMLSFLVQVSRRSRAS